MRLLLSIIFVFTTSILISQASSDSLHLFADDQPLPVVNLIEQVASPCDSMSIFSPKRKSFEFLTKVPADLLQIGVAPFKKENLKGLIITAATTGLLIPLDQQILDGTRHFLDQLHLKQEAQYVVSLKVGQNTKLLKLPKNVTAVFYEMGEGSISLCVAGGLFLFGKIEKDQRAVHTAADITETFFSMGIATQLFKRISGRQSPSFATVPGGKWQPFPSSRNFQENTTNYDAFPSGHLATMMATVTAIALNYPEKKWIRPVGYSIMTLTSIAMVNTRVHWVGDYPLALALGYLAAKITYMRNNPDHHRKHVLTSI